MPIATSRRTDPSHAMLHQFHVNVKMFGAVGDNSTDDTTAIQNAVNAARAIGGPASVYFPLGTYLTSSTITLNDTGFPAGQGVHMTGAGSSNPDPNGSRAQSVVLGNFSGPLFKRDTAVSEGGFSFEHLGFRNTHATGEGISLTDIHANSGMSNCWFQANKGVSFINNIFNAQVRNCAFQPGTAGAPAGSWGIYTAGHTNIYGCDIIGVDNGIRAKGPGISITGGRFEVNRIAINLGTSDTGATNQSTGRLSIIGISMEANDTGINYQNGGAALIAGIGIHGSAGSPSGGSLDGIVIGETYGVTFAGIQESGSHSTNFIRQASGSHNISFISCWSTTAWSLSTTNDHCLVLNCAPVTNRVEVPVIATASLPAAGTANDGQTIIEDNGAGDRNLIIYGGGQRFRIDGGSAF